MTILDDNSRFCWLFLLKSKAGKEVFSTFQAWAKKVERESGERIFRIRTDGGKEFHNKSFKAFCSERGYRQEFTNTDSPQQNGLSERQNWTLMSTMRSLLAASNLSEYWWGEALKTACYMRNRSSHSSLPKKMTPLQAWSGRLPKLDKMHTFGCMVAVLNLEKELHDKLKPRGRMGKFLGYPEDTTGYKILLGTGKMVTSSDVLFYDETILKFNSQLFQENPQLKDNLPAYPKKVVSPPPTPIRKRIQPEIPLSKNPIEITENSVAETQSDSNEQEYHSDDASEEGDQENPDLPPAVIELLSLHSESNSVATRSENVSHTTLSPSSPNLSQASNPQTETPMHDSPTSTSLSTEVEEDNSVGSARGNGSPATHTPTHTPTL
jgi:hypothetical protein